MFTKKQLILGGCLVAIAAILNAAVGFSEFVNTAVLGFFPLLGCWFWYDNYRQKETEKNNKRE
ncbi:hypothetical protein [Oceanobacillus locisalsi]|uniref:TMhelix containing protein n=1 Tax=Oceanobacillus locisalsi TaxID=546107 RepID=A0ABW3ND13_9BACI